MIKTLKRRNSKIIKAADLFCGAGGTSTGCKQAVESQGKKLDLVCVNHWNTAIATHKKNHPYARHYIEDVNNADPEELVPEGYLNLLMASPECRFYSRARGGKPVHDQGRMNPWVIHRWITALNIDSVLCENVTEFLNWGPLLPDGRPDPKHKGEYFQAWFLTFEKLGYHAEWKFLNAADYGDATTRIRFFLIARKDGKPIIWPEPTHSATGEATMIEHRKKWRAAREIIDWSNSGKSLFDDPKYIKKPLSQKTMSRISRGLQKFGGPLASYYVSLLGFETEENGGSVTPKPFIMGKQSDPSYRSTEDPLLTITTQDAPHLIEPASFLMGKQGHSPAYRSADDPVMTLTTEGRPDLIDLDIRPFVIGQQSGAVPRDVNNPIPTITTAGKIRLINPALIKYYGTGVPHSVDEPIGTQTTKERFGLAQGITEPFMLNRHGDNGGDRTRDTEKPMPTATGRGAGYLIIPGADPFLSPFYGVDKKHGARAHSVNEPIRTISTSNRFGIVRPFITANFGERRGQEPRTHDIDDPVPTVTSKGAGSLVKPVLIEINHSKGNGSPESTEKPLHTLTTKQSQAIVNPFLVDVNHDGVDRRVHSVDKPLQTMTTKRGTAAVNPFIVQWDQTGSHGNCVRSINDPLYTIVTKQNSGLVDPALVEVTAEKVESAKDYIEVDPRRLIWINDELHLLDIRFRMLDNPELAKAMGFSDEETEYEFIGTKSDITRQIGNAVPVGIARALVTAIISQ